MILVVEDHPENRRLLVWFLRHEGYAVTACDDGRRALHVLDDCVPRLVILDYGLPGLDGLGVFRAIRRDPRLAGTRVLMFSAFDGPARDAALAAGVDAYVVKGAVDLAALGDLVRQLAGPPAPELPPPCPPAGLPVTSL